MPQPRVAKRTLGAESTRTIYPEGFVFHSPGSRSAPWVGIDPNHLPRRGLIMPQSLHRCSTKERRASHQSDGTPSGYGWAGVFFP